MNFLEWFRTKYRHDFPIGLSRTLLPIDTLVWVSPELEGRITHPPMVPEFRAEPTHHAIAGEWGRGVNSYAFYFVEQRGPHRRFFRIFSGGVYGRPEEDSQRVYEYLAGYERWRARHEALFVESTLVCNMGNSSAELSMADGRRFEHRGFEEGGAWWEALEKHMP